jgi:hypothetical protein
MSELNGFLLGDAKRPLGEALYRTLTAAHNASIAVGLCAMSCD